MNNIKENIYLAALLHHEAFRDLQKKFCSDDVLAKYSNIIDKAQMLSLGLGEKSMPPALCPP